MFPSEYAAFSRTYVFSSVVRASINGSIAFSLPKSLSANAAIPLTSLFLSSFVERVVRILINGSIVFSLSIPERAYAAISRSSFSLAHLFPFSLAVGGMVRASIKGGKSFY